MYVLLTCSLIASLVQLGRCSETVTCGSVLKLMNVKYKNRLHSHEVTYGTGSRMQSVTAVEEVESNNSFWLVKNTTGAECSRGRAILCGESIRLEHLVTSRNLHSHQFPAPMSDWYQEVAAFGTEGVGDNGDHWRLECESGSWYRDTYVKLFHLDTSLYLAGSGKVYSHPIQGQMEVVGLPDPSSAAQWYATQGIFFHNNPFQLNSFQSTTQVHEEL